MLLQTLLENAVKHGVSQARGPGRIEVIVRTTSDQVTLEVRNTGPPARDSGALPLAQDRRAKAKGSACTACASGSRATSAIARRSA